MPRSPLAALIGVPLARQDLECVLGAYPPIALFLLSQLSGVYANPDQLACVVGVVARLDQRPVGICA